MTDRLRTPTSPPQHLHPFTLDPSRWEAARSRAIRTGHTGGTACSAACKPVTVYERTRWGWLAWTSPGDDTLPEIPQQIGVLTPDATWLQRLALRWLTRRPAQRIALAPKIRASLRLSTAAAALISLLAGLFAISQGVPWNVALPAMALAPLLTDHLPDRLDARSRHHVRSVDGVSACRYLQRLAALHTYLVQVAADSDRYELRRSAEIGHHVMWDTAGLLQSQDTLSASAQLITSERLMVQLADQVAQILQRTPEPARTDQPRHRDQPPSPYPSDTRYDQHPHHTPRTAPLKGTLPVIQPSPGPAPRTPDVYLLFAHEPYYPGTGTQEINTTVVAADTLLHPQVRQPDGRRIHDLLTQGRRRGEIIPLATLTHELNGGADWLVVGDWERVTTDLLQLVQTQMCDALSLGLSEIARVLICAGPDHQVRAFDAAAGETTVYGPDDRAQVLTEVATFLTGVATEQPFWPGDGLLPPLYQST
ncbi:hypothetical protein [Streptomyces sp. NPDC058434]|uniref:hypothetical protein n=1 Tax=Streptomyces sp. NPDC058434 TaxID=3346498 RepID=UPI00365C7809